ncbi:MAG: carbohydrate ABC transporter permease, partial [Athalassotoga sp.]
SEYFILLKIVTPMMLPSLVAIFVLSFLYSWGEFLFALLLTVKNATTLPVGATLFITAYQIEWGNIAAVIVLSIVPPIILSFYLRKYMIEAYGGASKE